MKNKLSKYTFLLAGLLSFASCSEDDLTPSFADTDRVSQLLDMNNPLVKDLKENYSINLMTEFNDTLDFKFGFFTQVPNERWEKIIITHLPEEEKEFALNQFNTDILQYLNDDFKKMMPKKILLSKLTDVSECNGNPDKTMRWVDYPEKDYLSVICNDFSYMFSFNKQTIEGSSASNLATMRAHQMFHLLSTVIERNKLLSQIPQEFIDPVKDIYSFSLDTVAQMEPVLPVIPPRYGDPRYYKPEWYIGRGFVITKVFPNSMNYTTSYERILKIGSEYCHFPYKETDFISFLHMMVYGTTASNMTKYYLQAPLFCQRMRMAIEILEGWGVDIKRFNPALEQFYNN